MPEASEKFGVYFSHSWRPRDVDLNMLVWEEIAKWCELLVDVPDKSGVEAPYYINRIEELLRRSDLFLCVLTHRDAPAGDGEGDAALRCSAYSVFEIRLAERFDIPKLILYERKTGFRSPKWSRAGDAYIPFDRAAPETVPDKRQWRSIAEEIRKWVQWMVEHLKPLIYEQSYVAVSLYPETAPDYAEVIYSFRETLLAAGYEQIEPLASVSNNTSAFRILRQAGLVVAQLHTEDPISEQLCTVAHAKCIPAIRMRRGGERLPWLLQGHPGGYQHDIVDWNKPADLAPLIKLRAESMFRISHAFSDEKARDYFYSRIFTGSYVFISHTLKPPHRELVEHIYNLLRRHHVQPFEYHMANPSGEDWQKALEKQLAKTTHFVALLTEGYEVSEVCTHEVEGILKRGNEVTILPFMAVGRAVPHPKLKHLHHRLLEGADCRANAQVVVEQILESLGRG
jgi:hypothetical protein